MYLPIMLTQVVKLFKLVYLPYFLYKALKPLLEIVECASKSLSKFLIILLFVHAKNQMYIVL